MRYYCMYHIKEIGEGKTDLIAIRENGKGWKLYKWDDNVRRQYQADINGKGSHATCDDHLPNLQRDMGEVA